MDTRQINCEICGKLYHKYIYFIRKNKHNFCSEGCQYAWLRRNQVVFNCANCGIEKRRKNSYNKNLKSGYKFCSIKGRVQFQKKTGLFGMKGKKHTEETRRIMRLSQIGNNRHPVGVIHNVTSKARMLMSKSHKGVKLSEVHKNSIRKGCNTQEYKQVAKERRAKQVFPLKDTKIEVKIRTFLDTLQIEYFQHKYISEITHSYQCDFFIPSINLVVECDGDYWHKYPTGREVDHIRTKELIEKGFKVLRLWEHEIKVMDINKFQERLNENE
ncbi:MAG: DUF559 domain-containing protein [Nanoarchaeota archaeon]